MPDHEQPSRAELDNRAELQRRIDRERTQGEDRVEARQYLARKIELECQNETIDVDFLLHAYSDIYDQPVLMLMQDLQNRAALYYNVVEALKAPGSGATAADLKSQYAHLGLIFEDNDWPNPNGRDLMDKAISRINKLRTAILDTLRTHGRRLISDLNFDATLAVGVQVEFSWPPGFTITVQPEVTVRVPEAVAAQ
ncbi:hypothetical protein [Actinoplanes sp. GCM10030250]|uniref:hypothetical protein n=1 Tax=Actinoplanes sp. GCM10030250 TaxID=3273376 RepID=UPI00361613BE